MPEALSVEMEWPGGSVEAVTRVRLAPEVVKELRALAARDDVSVAEVVRRFIHLGLDKRRPKAGRR